MLRRRPSGCSRSRSWPVWSLIVVAGRARRPVVARRAPLRSRPRGVARARLDRASGLDRLAGRTPYASAPISDARPVHGRADGVPRRGVRPRPVDVLGPGRVGRDPARAVPLLPRHASTGSCSRRGPTAPLTSSASPTTPTSMPWPTPWTRWASRGPTTSDGVWAGRADVLARIGPDLTPELQFFALLPDPGVVLTSDTQGYLEYAVEAATGEADQPDLGRRRGGGRAVTSRRRSLHRRLHLRAPRHGRRRRHRSGPGRRAGRASRWRAPDDGVRDGDPARAAASASAWPSSPTTTRATTPTPRGSLGERPRARARAVTSPTASRCTSATAEGTVVQLDARAASRVSTCCRT